MPEVDPRAERDFLRWAMRILVGLSLLVLFPAALSRLRGQSVDSGPVWGFADLHTHPASHLGFGSVNGENGLFWGKPAHDGGMDLATSTSPANLLLDLPPCPSASIIVSLGYTHNNNTGNDPVKLVTDAQIVSAFDETSPGWAHQTQGAPDFENNSNNPPLPGWPAALTVDHQVMHIDNIHRAYLGGLRLMFASVTDDEVITKLWNQGFNLFGNPMPTHDIWFDYNSAKAQLQYITDLVNANSTWMQIVATPSQARNAINSNPPKLAVVLSLEMDSLTLEQIQMLVQQFHVVHVIPVHVVDNNSFGGTALYNDTFNGLNNFINGSCYSATSDPSVNPAVNSVNFMLATPCMQLESVGLGTVIDSDGTVNGKLQTVKAGLTFGSVLSAVAGFADPPGWLIGALGGLLSDFGINPYPSGTFGYLPYPSKPMPAPQQVPGQLNTKDLNRNQFYALMQMGLLLDVAHMGEKTALSALTLAQQYNYPLMDSHTGIRCDINCTNSGPLSAQTSGIIAVNERSLPTSQLQIIQQLGGVIGLGMVPGLFPNLPVGSPESPDPDPVTTWINNYTIALNLMGWKNVAIGTDANGLSPLIQQDTIPTSTSPYIINVATQFGCPNGVPVPGLTSSTCPSPLPQYQFGNRTYNFQTDGIANYGLLPDFIQAASQSRPVPVQYVPNPQCVQACTAVFNNCVKNWNPADYPKGTQPPCGRLENGCLAKCPYTGGGFKPGPAPTMQIAALFHSAEDTIEMWEKVEKVAPTLSDYDQTASGTLNVEISSGTTQFGLRVASPRPVIVGGTLNIVLLNGFVPRVGQTFVIMTAPTVTGTFATVNGQINAVEKFVVQYTDSEIILQVASL